MHDEVRYLLRERQRAGVVGDWGVYRALTSDLARLGYKDPAPVPMPVPEVSQETVSQEAAMVQPLPERAVAKKRGRPPRPRCEHGHIVGRCADCEGDDAPRAPTRSKRPVRAKE